MFCCYQDQQVRGRNELQIRPEDSFKVHSHSTGVHNWPVNDCLRHEITKSLSCQRAKSTAEFKTDSNVVVLVESQNELMESTAIGPFHTKSDC